MGAPERAGRLIPAPAQINRPAATSPTQTCTESRLRRWTSPTAPSPSPKRTRSVPPAITRPARPATKAGRPTGPFQVAAASANGPASSAPTWEGEPGPDVRVGGEPEVAGLQGSLACLVERRRALGREHPTDGPQERAKPENEHRTVREDARVRGRLERRPNASAAKVSPRRTRPPFTSHGASAVPDPSSLTYCARCEYSG